MRGYHFYVNGGVVWNWKGSVGIVFETLREKKENVDVASIYFFEKNTKKIEECFTFLM